MPSNVSSAKKSEPRDKAANVCYYARAPGINVCSQIATKGLRHHNPSSLQQPIIVVIAILQNGNIHSCVKIWRIWYLLCLPYHRYWWSSSSCPSSWRPETQTWLISKSARQCHAWQHFLTCLLGRHPNPNTNTFHSLNIWQEVKTLDNQTFNQVIGSWRPTQFHK